MQGEVSRKETRADPFIGEEQRHAVTGRRERGGDLGADEPSADDRHVLADGERPDAPVVRDRPVVDDAVGAEGQAPRRSARREEETLVSDGLPSLECDAPQAAVDRDGARPGATRDAGDRGEPDLGLLLPLPEALRERGARVRPHRLVAEENDRSGRVHRADPLRRGVPRHPAADQDVLEVGHSAQPYSDLRYSTRSDLSSSGSEAEVHEAVVVIDDVEQGRESAVVVEAALGGCTAPGAASCGSACRASGSPGSRRCRSPRPCAGSSPAR